MLSLVVDDYTGTMTGAGEAKDGVVVLHIIRGDGGGWCEEMLNLWSLVLSLCLSGERSREDGIMRRKDEKRNIVDAAINSSNFKFGR